MFLSIKTLIFVISTCSLLLARPLVPQEYLTKNLGNEWTPLNTKDNILLFSSTVKDSDLLAFRGIGVISVGIPEVLQVLGDVETQTKWIPYLVQKKILKTFSPTHIITYNLNDIPWPASDRDAILESKLEVLDNPKMIVIKTKSFDLEQSGKIQFESPVPNPSDDIVRAIINQSDFKIIPLSEGLLIDLDAHMDPKGLIPNFITNLVQEEWAADFMMQMESEAQKRKIRLQEGKEQLLPEYQKIIDQFQVMPGIF